MYPESKHFLQPHYPYPGLCHNLVLPGLLQGSTHLLLPCSHLKSIIRHLRISRVWTLPASHLISNFFFLSSRQNESSLVLSIFLFKGWYNRKLKRILSLKTLKSNTTTYHLCASKTFNLVSYTNFQMRITMLLVLLGCCKIRLDFWKCLKKTKCYRNI